MSEYLHGAYGESNVIGAPVALGAQSAIVVVGTAPVNQVENGDKNVNIPIRVSNIAEARKYFGYSGEWDKYTLCEAFHVFFEERGYGPLVCINVLDPATHRGQTSATKTATPSSGRVVFSGAEDIILDTVVLTHTVDSETVTLVKGTDYAIAYDFARKAIVATELSTGALGDTAITATYYSVTPTSIDDDDIIGSTDGSGLNKGLYAIKDVYQKCGMIPAYLIVPGFSSSKDVHEAMYLNSQKVNEHWDIFMYADLPLMNGSTQLTMDTIYAYKVANGYDKENEKVFWPLAKGTDGKTYHLSVLAMAALLENLHENDDIPYHSSSNLPVPLVENLYMGAAFEGRVWDDSIINNKLNKYGIASACYLGGRWVIWGAHCADYNPTDANFVNVAETSRMMLYYISNDFQNRHFEDVDQPLTANDIASLVSEEQARLDALVQIGALTYGTAAVDASPDARSDIMNGDYKFTFDITTTPLAKSLKAIVNWVNNGFETYFATNAVVGE